MDRMEEVEVNERRNGVLLKPKTTRIWNKFMWHVWDPVAEFCKRVINFRVSLKYGCL